MDKPKLKIITTEDGSHSLFREDLKETYHSFHGALGESLHVFIEHGLQYVVDNGHVEIRIFEVGFGTGLNALLACNYANEHNVAVEFHSVEPFPVPEEVYKKLNYGSGEKEKDLLQKMHEASWDEAVEISPNFSIYKYPIRLEELDVGALKEHFQVVFFDAFAPSKQAELWELENLEKCYELLYQGGVLTTYCAQGKFKRDLAAAGFEVQTLKGALRKKEMVRGVKTN